MPASLSITRLALPLLAALGVALSGPACSLLVEDREKQCDTDAECESLFPDYPICVEGVCAFDPNRKPAGCFPHTPTTTEEFQNRCTGAECVPFDNCARLGLCGGELPLRVDPPSP